ncbi:MAG: hypothetical protein IPO91_18815 [Chloroflexi bacterium]|nr:hypothetical protein [Chloroflexota bacterium]
MEKRFSDIRSLLSGSLVHDEHSDTAPLIASLSHVREIGYFTRVEFLSMCMWKEPRQRRRQDWTANTEDQVQALSRQSLSASDEARRILHLCRLRGVGIPVASAFLTLVDPERYGVIDIRVWQLLALYQEVDYDPDGRALQVLHWLDYLDKIRLWAGEFNVSVRTIERTLFQHHREIQTERLYP